MSQYILILHRVIIIIYIGKRNLIAQRGMQTVTKQKAIQLQMQSVSTGNCVSAATSRKPSCVESETCEFFFCKLSLLRRRWITSRKKAVLLPSWSGSTFNEDSLSLFLSPCNTHTHPNTLILSLFLSLCYKHTHTLSLSLFPESSSFALSMLLPPAQLRKWRILKSFFALIELGRVSSSEEKPDNRIFQVRLDFCSMTVEPD